MNKPFWDGFWKGAFDATLVVGSAVVLVIWLLRLLRVIHD